MTRGKVLLNWPQCQQWAFWQAQKLREEVKKATNYRVRILVRRKPEQLKYADSILNKYPNNCKAYNDLETGTFRCFNNDLSSFY